MNVTISNVVVYGFLFGLGFAVAQTVWGLIVAAVQRARS